MHKINLIKVVGCNTSKHRLLTAKKKELDGTNRYNGGIKLVCYPVSAGTRYRSALFCWKIIIDFLKVYGTVNTTQEQCDNMREILSWICTSCRAPLDDWHVTRLEYCHNAIIPDAAERALFMELYQQLPKRICRAKRKKQYEDSVYYTGGSRRINIYDKTAERQSKRQPVESWEVDVIRFEVQVLRNHIDHMRRTYYMERTYDTWVRADMERYYLWLAAKMIPQGDFYKMGEAVAMVEASSYSRTIKANMVEYMEAVKVGGMDAANKQWCYGTVRNYLERFDEIGVSPITIPDGSTIDRLDNPFKGL